MESKISRKFKDFKYRISLLEKKQKCIYGIIIGFAVVLVITLILVFENANYSNLKLYVTDSPGVQTVYSINKTARSSTIHESGVVYYRFTENQRKQIAKFYKGNTNAALKLQLQVTPSEKQFETIEEDEALPFSFGFITEEDFSGLKFKFNKYNRILVKGDFKQVFPTLKEMHEQGEKKIAFVFDVSLAIPRKEKYSAYDNIPVGFYVESDIGCTISKATVAPAVIGFDFSTGENFYGFSSTGGTIDFVGQKADFSGASLIFPVQFTSENVMPQITLKFVEGCEKSTPEKNIYIGMNIGGERLRIKCVEGLSQISIPTAGIDSPFALTEVFENKEHISAILMEQGDINQRIENSQEVLVPIKTDPGLILNWNQKNWRCKDYEIYKWDRFSGILFFDIRDLKIQEKFFSRLAFYVEKEGYRGRILSNEELEGKHGYNAHDYSAESLASFFNKASDIKFKLNREEEILKKILLENGIIAIDKSNPRHVIAHAGGLVSISKQTPDWSRRRLLAHEGWHTLYFENEEFRNFVAACFYTIDPKAHDFLIDFFKSQPSLGYDVTDEYLIINEFMAYILQQPLNQVVKYFTGIASWQTVTEYSPELSAYIRETKAQAFEDAAVMLNEYLFDHWGIESGNISLISFN